MKHADVPAALELVVEEVGKESQRIRDAGSEALKAGKLKPAKKAISKIAYVKSAAKALGVKIVVKSHGVAEARRDLSPQGA